MNIKSIIGILIIVMIFVGGIYALVTLKELDPNSFQCIEVEYSKGGKISLISLDGLITQDFHMTS